MDRMYYKVEISLLSFYIKYGKTKTIAYNISAHKYFTDRLHKWLIMTINHILFQITQL